LPETTSLPGAHCVPPLREEEGEKGGEKKMVIPRGREIPSSHRDQNWGRPERRLRCGSKGGQKETAGGEERFFLQVGAGGGHKSGSDPKKNSFGRRALGGSGKRSKAKKIPENGQALCPGGLAGPSQSMVPAPLFGELGDYLWLTRSDKDICMGTVRRVR